MMKSVSEVVRAGTLNVWEEEAPGLKLAPLSVARGLLQPSHLKVAA